MDRRSSREPPSCRMQNLSGFGLSTVNISALAISQSSNTELTSRHDSDAQQALFVMIRRETSSDRILAEIKRYHLEGKSLSWFQDVIPELVPGVEGEASWLAEARRTLWEPTIFAQHDRKCMHSANLSRNGRPILSRDEFELRRYWPVIVETLQPMSNKLAAAVNEVSRALARTDCILPQSTNSRDSVLSDTPSQSYEFTVVRQAIQDKIISPLINEISLQLNEQDELSNEGEQCEEFVTASHARTEFTLRRQQILDLKQSLQGVQAVVISENDEHYDMARKRPAPPNEDTDRRKRQELGAIEEEVTSQAFKRGQAKTFGAVAT